MLALDQNQAWQLARYVSDLQEWFQLRYLRPISVALERLMPAEIATIQTQLRDMVNFLQGPDFPVHVGPQQLPIIKLALLLQKRQVSERQEQLRSKTPHHQLNAEIDGLMKPITFLMAGPWFKECQVLRVPPLTESLTLHAARSALQMNQDPPEDRLDDKFGYLQSQSSFLTRLAACRTESWLRSVDFCVAFVDIDDFKRFNTKYGETVVDRDLLPRLMQTLEAHAFAHATVFRFGGDEYVVLLPNSTATVAATFLRELQRKLAALRFAGISDTVTVSVGLCSVSYDSFLTDREILDAADRAKGQAKAVPGKHHIVKCDVSDDGGMAFTVCDHSAPNQ